MRSSVCVCAFSKEFKSESARRNRVVMLTIIYAFYMCEHSTTVPRPMVNTNKSQPTIFSV